MTYKNMIFKQAFSTIKRRNAEMKRISKISYIENFDEEFYGVGSLPAVKIYLAVLPEREKIVERLLRKKYWLRLK
jgi:hypothetical protein